MSLNRKLSLFIVTGVALSLTGGSAHQSTISTEPISQAPQDGQETGAKLLAALEADDSIEVMMDDKYLEAPPLLANQIDATQSADSDTQEEISDKHNPHGGPKLSPSKAQRQSEHQAKMTDWWTNLINENRAKKGEVKPGGKQSTKAPKSVVYREQPLEQNPLLTIRHQLMAIRDKHRMLMFKSVPQLMQLDQKLVDSYRLCLRRKMPLYAGMLYRTRFYVVRLANEIKQERQVLEAIAKQIQKVLRNKSTNSTLVKAYHRQLAAPTSGVSTLSPLGSSRATVSDQDSIAQRNFLSSSSDESIGGNESSATSRRAISVQHIGKDDETGFSQEQLHEDKQTAAEHRQNLANNSERIKNQDDKSQSKFKNFLRKPVGNHGLSNEDRQRHEDDVLTNGAQKTKQRFYTVNINEVNLKKELGKAQALIDRVNASSHELIAVVDDIVYLFKLTSGSSNSGKGLSTSSKRFKKMMLKSPFQLFFERHAKAMKSTTPGDGTMSNSLMQLNVNNMPEMKPIFDSPSFTVYKDPVDVDLGFDAPAMLDI